MTNIEIFKDVEFGKVRTMSNAQVGALFCGKDVPRRWVCSKLFSYIQPSGFAFFLAFP